MQAKGRTGKGPLPAHMEVITSRFFTKYSTPDQMVVTTITATQDSIVKSLVKMNRLSSVLNTIYAAKELTMFLFPLNVSKLLDI